MRSRASGTPACQASSSQAPTLLVDQSDQSGIRDLMLLVQPNAA